MQTIVQLLDCLGLPVDDAWIAEFVPLIQQPTPPSGP